MFEQIVLPHSASARVAVAGSTSNLGPGFDLVGLALSLVLEVECGPVRESAQAPIEFGPGSEDWPRGAGNLLTVAFERATREAGSYPQARSFRVRSEIPMSRGLGSSAAAVAAGLLLGAACGPRPVTRERLLELGVEIEGHPDNVSPALLGGCILSLPRAGQPPRVVRQALHPGLAFAVAWPAATLETRFARGLLPAQVALRDAVENPRRLALLLEGLRTGERELVELGGEDRLHVPYRLPHIPGGKRALTAAREAGAWLATISGSGSALFFIAAADSIAAVAEAARAELDRESPPAVARVLEVVERAPELTLV
jgi:homoserine kinase